MSESEFPSYCWELRNPEGNTYAIFEVDQTMVGAAQGWCSDDDSTHKEGAAIMNTPLDPRKIQWAVNKGLGGGATRPALRQPWRCFYLEQVCVASTDHKDGVRL